MKLFGDLIRKYRENKKLPLRKVAASLDVDTSILSKIERGERQAVSDMIPILSKELDVDFKALQIIFLTNKIIKELGNEKFIKEALKQTEKELKSKTL